MTNTSSTSTKTAQSAASVTAKPIKMKMISELWKDTKFVHPTSGETVFVTYKDECCIGYGPSIGYTISYIRDTDQIWTKGVNINP